MFTLPDHFNTLLSRIEPAEERAKAAQEIPAQVREFLKESDAIETVEPHSRLAGSYARYTAIKDIKDVDIILLVSEAYRDKEPEEVLNALFSALHGLPDALGDVGEVVVRRHQRRSVNVHLEKSEFDLDIVPAVAVNGIDEPLDIPDKDWSKWVSTHPLGYAEKLSKLNEKNDDRVVPVVKLLKHWRDVHMTYRRPKSYWLECIVYHKFADGRISTVDKSYAENFCDLLNSIYDESSDFLSETGKVVVKDPMLDNNVAHNWERDAFDAFMQRIDKSRKWAERALNQNAEEKAVELWQNVFGEEWFPTTAQLKGESLHAALKAGGVFVTPTGRVQTQKPEGRSIQPPSQRFYGED